MNPEHWSGCLALMLYSAATSLRAQRELTDQGWAARSDLWWIAGQCGAVDRVDCFGHRHEATIR